MMLFCLIWESLARVSTGFVFNRGKPQTSTKRESKDGEGGGWGGVGGSTHLYQPWKSLRTILPSTPNKKNNSSAQRLHPYAERSHLFGNLFKAGKEVQPRPGFISDQRIHSVNKMRTCPVMSANRLIAGDRTSVSCHLFISIMHLSSRKVSDVTLVSSQALQQGAAWLRGD